MKSIVRKLAAATLALAGIIGQANAAGPHGLESASWLSEIQQAFAGVKGYSAVIVHEDGYVLQKAGGWAGSGDPMSWDHYANIGSVNKMVTTLFLIRLIEDKVGRGNVNAIEAELNRKVWDFVPNVVRNSTPAINRQITLRQLIQHKSGIRTEHASGNPFIDFLQPVSAANVNVRSYSNTNLKLLGYVAVAYGAPHILAQVNAQVAITASNAVSPNIPQWLGYYYWGMVQNRLLDEAPLAVFGSCWLEYHIVDYLDAPIALMYGTKGDALNSGGWYDGGKAAGHCKGQGGWYFSTRDMARLFRHLGTNSGVISPAAYERMYDWDGSAAARDNRLGWNKQIASPKLQSVFGWNSSPYHGGSHTISWNGKNITARAAMLRLPGGYHAVAVVNSNEMSSDDIANALKNAFARSIP